MVPPHKPRKISYGPAPRSVVSTSSITTNMSVAAIGNVKLGIDTRHRIWRFYLLQPSYLRVTLAFLLPTAFMAIIVWAFYVIINARHGTGTPGVYVVSSKEEKQILAALVIVLLVGLTVCWRLAETIMCAAKKWDKMVRERVYEGVKQGQHED